MSHPNLLAQLLGRPLPAQPGESGASDVPAVAPSVQAGAGYEAAQCDHRWVAFTLGIGPTRQQCEVCGEVRPMPVFTGWSRERDAEWRGALDAVARRAFDGCGR